MLILGSSSETRGKILKDENIDFKQRSFIFDESRVKETDPESFVYQVALGKLNAYEEKYNDNIPFLIADTVVSCNGKILGKARNIHEAREFLNMQSNNIVCIITCMIYKKDNLKLIDTSFTQYKFSKFKNTENYLASNAWEGKAGALEVEGFCMPFIENVIGYKSTAMGLCVEKLKIFLD